MLRVSGLGECQISKSLSFVMLNACEASPESESLQGGVFLVCSTASAVRDASPFFRKAFAVLLGRKGGRFAKDRRNNSLGFFVSCRCAFDFLQLTNDN